MKEESSDIELNGLSDKQIVDLLREVNQEVIQSAGIIFTCCEGQNMLQCKTDIKIVAGDQHNSIDLS